MSRLLELQHHIMDLRALLDVVGATRSLASMRMQEAQRTLVGIRSYAHSMAGAIASVMRLGPQLGSEAKPGHERRGLLLIAGEHGFVGEYNERLLDAAAAELGPGDSLFVLGTRGAALAAQRGPRPNWHGALAMRLSSLPQTLRQLEAEFYPRIARGELMRIDVMFARFRQDSPLAVVRQSLFPLDLDALPKSVQPAEPAPLHNLPLHELLDQLMADYAFAVLMAAAVEAIASENSARFVAMESGRSNLERKLHDLGEQANQARQAEITEELLDLIIGSGMIGGNNR